MIYVNGEEFQDLRSAIENLTDEVTKLSPQRDHIIYGNDEFCSKMKISKKTAQRWRDKGLIKYSVIGKSIFYRLTDIIDMLERNSNDVFS